MKLEPTKYMMQCPQCGHLRAKVNYQNGVCGWCADKLREQHRAYQSAQFEAERQARNAEIDARYQQSYQPQQSYQSPQQNYQDPMAGVDWDFWGGNKTYQQAGLFVFFYGMLSLMFWAFNPQRLKSLVRSTAIIFGVLIVFSIAISFLVIVVPILLAALVFLFKVALVVGAIVGVIWLVVAVINAYSGENNPQ